MASSRAMDEEFDPCLTGDVVTGSQAMDFGTGIFVDYKNDEGKEALLEALDPLLQEGIISISKPGEYHRGMERRLVPLSPTETLMQDNIQVCLDNVSECDTGCQIAFEFVMEEHTKKFYKKDKKVKLSSNSVEVTGKSVDQTERLYITYKHIFVFKEGWNVEGIDASALALDILEKDKDRKKFSKKLKKEPEFDNLSGITQAMIIDSSDAPSVASSLSTAPSSKPTIQYDMCVVECGWLCPSAAPSSVPSLSSAPTLSSAPSSYCDRCDLLAEWKDGGYCAEDTTEIRLCK